MSRHRKSDAGAPARIASLKVMRVALAAEFGLEPSDARIGQAALVKLNQENWQGQILLGRPVPACELEAYTNTVAALLGKPKTDLNVHFIYECFHCKEQSTVDPDTLCAKCRAELPPQSERVPEPATAAVHAAKHPIADSTQNAPETVPAPTLPPQPATNVVPIKSDTDLAPWRDITGTGRIEGQEPSWSPSGRFKCYGDIPDGF